MNGFILFIAIICGLFSGFGTGIRYGFLDTDKNENDLKKIYDAIIRGTNAFLETYNLNNPKEQIREITVGLNRNALS